MRILFLWDYVARTGFSTVSKNISTHLKKHFGANLKSDIVAVNYFGEDYWEDENTFVTSAQLNDDNNHEFGLYHFMKRIKLIDYDGIFICQDIGVIAPIIELLDFLKKEKAEQKRKIFKSIIYFPVDGNMVYEHVKDLHFFDLAVTYTEFGRNEIFKHRPELKGKIKVIPHGNNPKDFYPLTEDEKAIFRKEYFESNADKFIITNVNRNQPRKDIPNTIFGFMEARKIWDERLPKPFLYLHMHPDDPLGWNIRVIMKYTNLVEDVDYKLLPKEFENTMVDVPTLNKIYNVSDVFITTTLGGGWELSNTESMACGLPVICPYHTCLVEVSNYGKNAYTLQTLYPFCSPVDNNIREQTDIYEIADTLLHVAKMKYGLIESDIPIKTKAAQEWVKKLEWKEVCKIWIDYFKKIY